MTLSEYNKIHNVIKEGEHTYRIYINTFGYPEGFIFVAESEIELNNKWLEHCLNKGFCSNKNIKKIVLEQ